MLDYDFHEVQVKRTMIESSRVTLLVADHSKFNRTAMVRLGEINDVDYFFTDTPLPISVQEKLDADKVSVKICR